MSKNRIKKNLDATLTLADIESLVGVIALQKSAERAMTSQMDTEIQAVRDRYAKPLQNVAEAIDYATEKIQHWAEANPAEFGKKKSIDFTSGTIGFRTGTPKLALLNRKWNWKTALEAVQHWLPNFIRSAPEIDKEALLAQRDEQIIKETLPKVGLKVTQDESFYVEPNLTELETREVTPVKSAAA